MATNLPKLPDLTLLEKDFNNKEMSFITSTMELLNIDTMKKITYQDDYLRNNRMFSKYVNLTCEYGTIPIRCTINTEQYKWFEQKNKVIREILIQAKNPCCELKPHLIRRWVAFNVNISFLISKQYLIQFNYKYGCHTTFRNILKDFCNLIKLQHLWISRSNYIKLIEGCPPYEHEEKEEHKHITKYLFNDLVKREVCEFIGSEFGEKYNHNYSPKGNDMIIYLMIE